MDAAYIEFVGENDLIPISGIGFKDALGIKLGEDPEEMFDTAFERSTIPKSIGGRFGRTDIPPRRLSLPLNLSTHIEGRVDPDAMDSVISRLRKLFGPAMAPKKVMLRYTPTDGGSVRWLWIYLDRQIKVTPKTDWSRVKFVRAVVSAVALEPRYESKPLTVKTPAHSGGSQTYWLPVWNPTDQTGWLQWSLTPNGATSFTIPDRGFGQEQSIDRTWTVGQHASRAIIIPSITVPWDVRSLKSGDDPYVAADLSNANGVMGGNYPLYGVPPYTGRKSAPVLLPVTINGPAGAEVLLTVRRFWSAESGLE